MLLSEALAQARGYLLVDCDQLCEGIPHHQRLPSLVDESRAHRSLWGSQRELVLVRELQVPVRVHELQVPVRVHELQVPVLVHELQVPVRVRAHHIHCHYSGVVETGCRHHCSCCEAKRMAWVFLQEVLPSPRVRVQAQAQAQARAVVLGQVFSLAGVQERRLA